ncbi:MAG: hypothetical protein K8M05_18270 [Deltaproteobacteria bacterium]|nr:hypothetical protein [Kofleriaceae bacterium]
MKSVAVEMGAQVYLDEGGEVVGAVRAVAPDHILVFIEGAGDFVVKGPGVRASHHGKVILDPENVDPQLVEAARHAHEHETE